jgi:hypothetical protein
MDAAPPTLYRPRRPQESPLYRLVADHFDALVQVHEETFQHSHGQLVAEALAFFERLRVYAPGSY